MGIDKYFAIADKLPEANEAFVLMDRTKYKGCMYNRASWVSAPYKKEGMIQHESDELLVFMGGDPDDPENLNMEVTLRIENDELSIKKTSIVFIPAGVAHGEMEIREITRAGIIYTCHLWRDEYTEREAEATAGIGTYAGNVIERYEPTSGILPPAPEGFLTYLLWIDGQKLSGAPYMEAVWFKTTNDTGPSEHEHDFDEFIGFLGSDPEQPEELGGEIEFYIEGEKKTITKNCLIYIPRGVKHGPLLVPKLEKPLIHFSGGNGGDYIRRDSGS